MTARARLHRDDSSWLGPISPSSRPNFLLLTWDSCRWDSFSKASLPRIRSVAKIHPAYSQATFTLASHLAMYQGLLPHVRQPIPYYNRYVRQLVRIRHRPTSMESLVSFPSDTPNIITGFRRFGYLTIGIAAMEWFHHPILKDPYEKFHFTGIHGIRQVELFSDDISSNHSRPFFALINFGETHYPYRFSSDGVKDVEPTRAQAWDRVPTDREYDNEGFTAQIHCCQFLDDRLADIITVLKGCSAPTIVVLCGDHGECFGEDGAFGHGFYHPKVMEVPMAIFRVASY